MNPSSLSVKGTAFGIFVNVSDRHSPKQAQQVDVKEYTKSKKVIVTSMLNVEEEMKAHQQWLQNGTFKLLELPRPLIACIYNRVARNVRSNVVNVAKTLRDIVWEEQVASIEDEIATLEELIAAPNHEEIAVVWSNAQKEFEESLSKLKKADFSELRCFRSPPAMLLAVSELICRVFMAKPQKIRDPNSDEFHSQQMLRPS